MDYFTIIFIAIIVLLNILATRKLFLSKRLSNKVKAIQIILTWGIPLVWALLIMLFSTKPPKKTGKFERGRYMPSGYDHGHTSAGF